MTTLREAAQQALEAMLNFPDDISDDMFESITALKAALVEDAMQKFTDVNQEIEAALAEPVQEPDNKADSIRWQLCLLAQTEEFSDEVRNQIARGVWLIDRLTEAALAEPQEPKPVEFDHGIGADRFKVVRGAFWWHVLIGDSPTEHGKFRSRASAEKMAADLLREFRNGAFVQHEAVAEQVQEQPVCDECGKSKCDGWALYCVKCVEPMFTSPHRIT